MTVHPFYEPQILKIPLEKYAEIAIDAGIWLVGELSAQGLPANGVFVPDTAYIFRSRHQEITITELCQIKEDLRHRIFIAGFLKLPDNGAQTTFQRLLVTHTEMLHEAFRIEWKRRAGKMVDVSEPYDCAQASGIGRLATGEDAAIFRLYLQRDDHQP